MKTQTQQKSPWYDNTIFVHLLLVLVFPLGLYLLWQSTAFAKWWKVTATIIIAFLVIVNLGDTDNATSTSKLYSPNSPYILKEIF